MSAGRARAQPGLDPRLAAQAQAAFARLGEGRFAEAAALLAPVAAAVPGEPDVRRALAEALRGAGDLPAAEIEARAAVSADRRRSLAFVTLAAVLEAQGRAPEAEKALRQALALDRRCGPAALRLNRLLLAAGRAREAAQATAALAATAPDAALLCAHAEALKAEGRREEALVAYRHARDLDPAGGVGAHNVASLLADLRRDAEALAETDAALAQGLDAAATWLVRAHALQGLNRHAEAQAAYEAAVARDPGLEVAVTDLARLVWMRTGDLPAARAVYDRAAAATGGATRTLRVDLARLLDFAGEPAEALKVLEAAGAGDPRVHAAAAGLAARTDPDRAARHAEAALAARPDDWGLRLLLGEVRLAQGRAEEAAAAAAALVTEAPENQQALALQAAAWRVLSDPRANALYDYPAFVAAYRIAAPPGWSDLPAFLRDLAAELTALHALEAHPVGQSLRGGAQTSVNLLANGGPAVRAAFQAFDAPIRAHMARLGKGRDPVRRRGAGACGYRFAGAWSVRLKPGGRHVDHIHSEGWLSSAFYVDLPPAVEAGGREGWIRFGQPGLPHGDPPLEPGLWLKPEPGALVLFPSCMWHGTAPFGGEHPRLTMAFDVVPA